MLRKLTFYILAIVCLPVLIYGQKINYQIEFQKTTGQLTKSDLTKKDFGRYDGYEINFHEGERVHFLVYSENFTPSLVLVNPQGQTYQQDIEKNDEYATIQTKINQSGNWILYVLGDQDATGEYYFQYGIAGDNLFLLDENAGFCEQVDFLLAHATAYFIFLGDDEDILKIDGATDAYIDGHDASYDAKLYDGNSLDDAERMYDYVVDELKSCVDKKWKTSDRGWMRVKDYNEKYFILTENKSNEPRFLRVGLLDFRESANHVLNDFLVDITIGKK